MQQSVLRPESRLSAHDLVVEKSDDVVRTPSIQSASFLRALIHLMTQVPTKLLIFGVGQISVRGPEDGIKNNESGDGRNVHRPFECLDGEILDYPVCENGKVPNEQAGGPIYPRLTLRTRDRLKRQPLRLVRG